MIEFSLTLRLSGPDKVYYLNQLKAFCAIDFGDKVKKIEFGKQDPFSAPSISFFDGVGISKQKHFPNNRELLAFIEGYVQANAEVDEFKR